MAINKKAGRPKKVVIEEANIDFSEWIQTKPEVKCGSLISENEVAVRFIENKTSESQISKTHSVLIKIGQNVAEQLKWKANDKICIFNHKDDLMQFILVKRDSGYKLTAVKNSSLLQIRYLWKNALSLRALRTHSIDFHIHKLGYLIFRVNMSPSTM